MNVITRFSYQINFFWAIMFMNVTKSYIQYEVIVSVKSFLLFSFCTVRIICLNSAWLFNFCLTQQEQDGHHKM